MIDDRARMTPDERYEQAALAQMGERRNRPKHLLVLGVLALCVAFIALVGAWYTRAGAARELERRESRLVELAELTSEWLALNQTEESESGDEGRIPQSRVRELATQAGMSAVPPLAQPRIDPYQNARRERYRYNVRDVSLASLMSWVDLMLGEFRGVWVHEIEVKPSGNEWQLLVVFARWEQSST